jgi:serine/threonine-protein kinase
MIGRKLRQRYQIIKKLGSGGFGETYLAEDLDIPVTPKPKCVVKQLKPKVIAPDIPQIPLEDIVRLFEKEGETLYELGQNHDQIPKLYAYFEQNRKLYLVQEFIDGYDLSQEIISGKQWSETEVIKFLEEILKVLAFVHQNNVIHRDIKPSNIMRRRCDGKLILIDFGLVKLVNASGAVSSTIPIGTHGYVPIEQARGQPRFSSDIYAVGMTAIQALSGIDNPSKLPEDNNGEVVWRDRTSVSDWLANILTKMVRYDFRERYQSATEALQALNKVMALLPSSIAVLIQKTPPPTAEFPPDLIASPRPVKIDKKWGYMDQTRQVVIQPQFNFASEFSEGLAVVEIDHKKGYINQSGQIVIQPQFLEAYGFSEGLAAVRIISMWGYGYIDKFGYIDKSGQIAIQPHFDRTSSFSKGLAAIKIDNNWGYIDQTGRVVIQPQFIEALDFSEELASVKIGTKWGYIDQTGQVIIPMEFDGAFPFSEGVAAVWSNKKSGYIDQTGQVVVQPQFDYAFSFHEGLAAVQSNKKWGYINQTGEVVIQLQFDSAGGFAEGLAVVQIGAQCGYIDQTGQVVVQPQFNFAFDFSEGMALVMLGRDCRYIDKTGKFIY